MEGSCDGRQRRPRDGVDDLAKFKLKEEGQVLNAASFTRHFVVIVFLTTPQPKFDSQSKVRLASKVDLHLVLIDTVFVDYLATMPFIADETTSASTKLAKELNSHIVVSKSHSSAVSRSWWMPLLQVRRKTDSEDPYCHGRRLCQIARIEFLVEHSA